MTLPWKEIPPFKERNDMKAVLSECKQGDLEDTCPGLEKV